MTESGLLGKNSHNHRVKKKKSLCGETLPLEKYSYFCPSSIRFKSGYAEVIVIGG
jgi:hypothetical protein